ncbi:MAG TPA: DUF4214 domain-containing protein [Pyrinomonadaceae bacterium]|nr:DUF4214 domain-containing protein [Pyrinomonadaceae bacterium]
MRKIAVAFTLLTLMAAGVVAQGQSAPTLRIVTEDPTLPSELFYGNIKVKPLRLRPGTNTPITIDDSDFFIHQHYIDFLSRMAETGGFNDWMAYLNGCPGGDPICLHDRRLVASAGFFGSPEFRNKGYFAYRFYKASLGRQPLYTEMVADMRTLTGTAAEVEAKRTAFANAWVNRTDFLASFPNGMAPTAFVDGILQVAGITVANRNQIISDLSANNTPTGRAAALRAIVESPEEDLKEFNRAFVYMQYVGYLRRDPEEQGYNNWLNYLNANPQNQSEMIRGFVDSIEYRNRF